MELGKQALVVALMAQGSVQAQEALDIQALVVEVAVVAQQEVAVVALLAEVAEEELQEVVVELQELALECQHK